MEKYITMNDGLTELQFILDELKDPMYKGKTNDEIDLRINDAVMQKFVLIENQVDKLKKLIERIIKCNNDGERLDVYLEYIFLQEISSN